VPVKAFELAKGRLARHLDEDDRSRLARDLASRVLNAAGRLDRYVTCDSDEVARWALELGAGVIRHPEPGLNQAVAHAVAQLRAADLDRVIVAHGDLPLATDLTWVGNYDGVTIVPDRRGDGTNVLAIPIGADFRFAYGPGSAQRHRAEAQRLGLPLRVVADEALGWDIDTPDDLALFDSLPPSDRAPLPPRRRGRR
jgi:2-phospho-L-lactate guanylyltransferase